MRSKITAVGHFAPSRKLTNCDLEKMVNTNDEWIRTRTGIKERRVLDPQRGTSFMAIKAAEMVLAQRGLAPDEIDVIIVATVTPDQLVPAAAALVQKGLKAGKCWGFDLNGGCTGFLCAVTTGAQFIESGAHQRVLVIGADKMSAIVDYQDRNTCVLFGDAAGAVLLEPCEEAEGDLGIRDFILCLDGSGSEYLKIPAGGSLLPATQETVARRMHYVYQDGRSVFKHAVKEMADVATRIMTRNNLGSDDIRLFIPHQANYRIIDATAKKMGLAPEQVFINIARYGNTTAATIPMAMSEAYRAGRLGKGDWIILAAFGAGFTWGSMLLKWAMTQPAPG
jgi:3-oxoacyl-[acyl-carrier-protein] synthase-3